jgi:hypothetical protein
VTVPSGYVNAQGYGLGAQIVAYAARYLGVPYVWGGTDPSGFDCSGLVQWAFDHFGIQLPRVAADQATVGQRFTDPSLLQPGDLVFSSWGSEQGIGHVGIYAGSGQILEASQSGTPVHYVPLDANYLNHVKWFTRDTGPLGATPGTQPAGFNNALGLGDVPGLGVVGKAISGFANDIKNLAIAAPFVIGGSALVVVGVTKSVKQEGGA